MLRDISQLTMRLRADGMTITYGNETLIVQSADGGPIDYRSLQTSDVIGGSRLSTIIVPDTPALRHRRRTATKALTQPLIKVGRTVR